MCWMPLPPGTHDVKVRSAGLRYPPESKSVVLFGAQ
jgi:hypothetical protein